MIKLEQTAPYRGRVFLLRHEFRVLQHLAGIPGICQVYHFERDIQDGGKTYDGFLMQRLGPDLDELRSQNPGFKLPMKTVLLLADHLIFILRSVHFRGVVHRDIKPNNILLGEGNQPYLCDWGLALKNTPQGVKGFVQQLGKLVGSPDYASISSLDGFGESSTNCNVNELHEMSS